jgi:hypothetical protein
MSLTGSLDVFPLTEVLRLLARSGRTGRLTVETDTHVGRIYVESGGLTLASTVEDGELARRYVAAGLVSETAADDPAALSQRPIASPGAVADFVRELTIESLFRIDRSGTSFVFHVDETPAYPTGQRFDPEVAMADAGRRAAEWADIEAVVPGLDVELTMQPDLGDAEEVTLSAATWRFLAGLGGGTSISDLAERSGSTEFIVAKEAASLIRKGLVRAVGDVPEAPAGTPATDERAPGGWWSEKEEPAAELEGDRFLESVFAELDEQDAEDVDDEDGFARGAIRKRLDENGDAS